MKVTKAEILTSAVEPAHYPKSHVPEIALAGRSNVGKSSFINRLLGRKNLVRTSSKPGKTRTLNFYNINDSLHFVDVPGYGYAKVSKQERNKWGKMMEAYFESREQLRAVVLVVDSRHKPTQEDVQMFDYMMYLDIPLLVVATKYDKLKKSQQHKHLKQIKSVLDAEANGVPVIPFSAVTGVNKDLVWREIERYL
ncbi:MAG TPA: ribosome biogenesis GTP-binding protein YihA/YsxC [Pseudogracilibacillus sp.]|nr:ribosome biogenesis GTP-binding protein YihA/YsxC [Pseudogracilibacillus sp.]